MPPPSVVLCIDDRPVLEYAKGFLKYFGYTVLTATGGAEGLKLASLHPVDIVIVDYEMRNIDWAEVVAEMRRLRPKARIIMLSGAGIPEQVRRMVDAFVPKKYISSHLLPAVGRLTA